MIEKYSTDSELRALDRIRLRCNSGMGGRSFSPLENIDGTNPILESIDALQASPLCWEGMPTMGDYGRIRRMLESLRDLYERALIPWDEFRKVQNPRRSMYVLGMGNPTDIDLGRPTFTFPVSIRREAKLRYFELMTTSRFSVEDEPSKSKLEEIHSSSGALTFAHLAGLAATVCVVRAVDEFEKTLKDWADVCDIEPGQPFMWLARHDHVRIEDLLTAYMASPFGDQGYASEREQEVSILVKSAESWLALMNADERHQSDIEHVTLLVEAKTTNAVRAQTEKETLAYVADRNTIRASRSAKNPRGKAKGLSAQMVANGFKARPDTKFEVVQSELAEEHKVSERTIARRYKEAKEKNLLP